MKDLRILPKLRDSMSYLYIEHGVIDQDMKAIAVHNENGKVPVPCAALTLLMLGPGTKITHAAIKVLAETGCMVVWCGEQGVRLYAYGNGDTRDASRLIRQAMLVSNPALRLKVVVKMYQMRFKESISKDYSIQQIRGMEGVRVRETYAKVSRDTGVEWSGRSYKSSDWNASDPVNKALSAANSCLYGLCQAAIVSLGYSPGLGFIHIGKQLSFVYDVADYYKTETSIPVAFNAASQNIIGIERNVRLAMRDVFKETRLLQTIADDIEKMLDISEVEYERERQELDDDSSIPGQLWDPEGHKITGGKNYGDENME